MADRFGVKTIDAKQLEAFKHDPERNVYVIDLRTPEEYLAGHRPDSTYGWGVQLVQVMDKYAATRNARVVLVNTGPLTWTGSQATGQASRSRAR